ncbi:MAG: dihydroorotate dehydrogenase (quinone), partial [Bacteroidota bacterium]
MMAPERAHHFVFSTLGIACKIPGIKRLIRLVSGRIKSTESVEVAGLLFPNRIGLAAGFDKDALLFEELGAFGFGFVEIGTVTPLSQPGNPKPRLFRLPADEALINRMGFNNRGVQAAAHRLKKRKKGLVIGGNIGKNKITPNDLAVDDYVSCFKMLFDHVDYFV